MKTLNLNMPRHSWYWHLVVTPEQHRRKTLLCVFVAIFMAMWASGCQPQFPLIDNKPAPSPPVQTIRIEVGGTGQVTVGGDAKIAVGANKASESSACNCGCGQNGCQCSANLSSSAGSGPQFTTRYERRQVCENGVCRIVTVPVQVPVSSVSKQGVGSGKIKVYVGSSPACGAMRDALRGMSGVDFERGTPPTIDGVRWYPTAVKPDGSSWTPGSGGWHSGSLAEFSAWAEK